MIKDNNIPIEIRRTLSVSNDLTKLRLENCRNRSVGAEEPVRPPTNRTVIKDLSYELYKRLKDENQLGLLDHHKDAVHQRLCRLSLIDQLLNDSDQYDWDYWCVVTFGYFPHRSLTNDVLSSAHYRFDSWIKTNLKLSFMDVKDRSRWVCLPERGGNGHLHYNCFIKLQTRPAIKTYAKANGKQNEWSAVRYGMNKSLEACQKAYDTKKIDFRLYERRKVKKDALKMAIYSTKEMEEKWIQEHNGEDHFAQYIRSWEDWDVKPITRSSPKKITAIPKPTTTLTQFMS